MKEDPGARNPTIALAAQEQEQGSAITPSCLGGLEDPCSPPRGNGERRSQAWPAVPSWAASERHRQL